MKRFLTLFIAALSALTCVFAAACGKTNEDSKNGGAGGSDPVLPETISVYAPDGAPALSIAKFINDDEKFGTTSTFDYHVVSATEINNAIIRDNADMVIMPLNDATKIYKKADNGANDYVMAAVITHGNFYVLSKGEISSVNDLIGKVVYVPMRGKVPDLTFRAALKVNGIEYVESETAENGKVAIKYYAQPSDYLAALKQNENAAGLVPEPAAANAHAKMELNYSLDVQELFDSEEKAYPQAVLMVKKTVAQNYLPLVLEMAGAFAGNVLWLKDNAAAAISAIKAKFDATTLNPATLSKTAIENCKIYWQGGVYAKAAVNNYIAKIREIDVNSAATVGDEFFL